MFEFEVSIKIKATQQSILSLAKVIKLIAGLLLVVAQVQMDNTITQVLNWLTIFLSFLF